MTIQLIITLISPDIKPISNTNVYAIQLIY